MAHVHDVVYRKADEDDEAYRLCDSEWPPQELNAAHNSRQDHEDRNSGLNADN